MNTTLQRLMYRHGWDTRSRNVLPARLVRPILGRAPGKDQPPLLDVGCGNPGLASFLTDVSIVGVDLEAPSAPMANIEFHRGSVLALPFPDRAFPVVTCIDVLEHLPEGDRLKAVRELVRVASQAVLIACPHGTTARDCDETFRRASMLRHRPLPSWVEEHLEHPYPTASAMSDYIESAAAFAGRRAAVSVSYCEPAAITRLVRSAAARSDLLYGLVNLLSGTVLSFLPLPGAQASYRMVLLAELQEASELGVSITQPSTHQFPRGGSNSSNQ
jgi:SAM-dependent methyltransferase